MGLTPCTCMYPKEKSRAKVPASIGLPCAQRASLRETKICSPGSDNGGAVGHSLGPLSPSPPKNSCAGVSALCRGWGREVGRQTPASWAIFWRHRSWGERGFALEPTEKSANSQVLVLGFSRAPRSTSCMPRPHPALQPAGPARRSLSPTGLGFAGLKTHGLRIL